jgi:hypothetical protein
MYAERLQIYEEIPKSLSYKDKGGERAVEMDFSFSFLLLINNFFNDSHF